MPPDQKFNALLRESFETTIRTVLGDTAGAALLYYVNFSVVDNPMERLGAMRAVLGAGSHTIEKLMLTELFDRLDAPYDEGRDPDFEAAVERAKMVVGSSEKGGNRR